MYRIVHSFSFECLSLADALLRINIILPRKLRHNGVGFYLARCLGDSGTFDETAAFGASVSGRRTEEGLYRIEVYSPIQEAVEAVHERVNRLSRLQAAIKATREHRHYRRKLRAQGNWVETQKPILRRVLAGDSANLKRHLGNTNITLGQAIDAIAYAARMPALAVHEKIFDSLSERNAGVVSVKGFVFRVNLQESFQGVVSNTAPVEVFSSKLSTRPEYRRLRTKLKALTGKESRAHKQRSVPAREYRRQGRQFRQQQRRHSAA